MAAADSGHERDTRPCLFLYRTRISDTSHHTWLVSPGHLRGRLALMVDIHMDWHFGVSFDA